MLRYLPRLEGERYPEEMSYEFTIEDIKKIRNLTGVGLTDAKRALEASGNFEEALAAMRAKGLGKVSQREDRPTQAGIIYSYIHDGRIGVLLEVNCETDFVAKNEIFLALVKDLALQITATDPLYIRPADAPEGDEAAAERCLWQQAFIKDAATTVGEMAEARMAQLGEKIVLSRFVRFSLDGSGQLVSVRDGG